MTTLQYTPVEEIEGIRNELRAGFASEKMKPIAYRKYQLQKLMYMVKDNMSKFEETLKSDLNRPVLESRFMELIPAITEALTQYKNVDKWAKPTKPPFNFNFFAMKPQIRKEPKGTVLIIAPFNYPVWLLLSPLAGALAAGNTVLLKPSESTPATSALLAEVVAKYLDKDVVRVVNGAVPETTKLLELQWDHSALFLAPIPIMVTVLLILRSSPQIVLYTGGANVAKIVATAAAKHLTPVSLELGGKSPVIVDSTCDLKTTAKRLLWGKTVNAGQTCVAPDYVLVPREFQDTLVNALKEVYEEFYPDASLRAGAPEAYSRIVTAQATNRIAGLLENTQGTVVVGGEVDKASKFIAPTIVKDVKATDSLMSQEIFGPILPIVPVDDIDEAIKFVNERDHPLALYVFSQDNEVKTKVFNKTQSGAAVANEVVIHTGADGLPFGGVGPSGYGMHTGIYSFEMFTHLRASLDSPSWVDAVLKFRYPPYTESKANAAMRLLGSLPARPTAPPSAAGQKWWGKWFIVAFAIAIAGGLTQKWKRLS
ncbi:NAD-aldehyde dehydrogenase [Panaeolus papilionaceus]|nr:NAD-aldehyde dehydrogenase [Panaeolus papilionaceus]